MPRGVPRQQKAVSRAMEVDEPEAQMPDEKENSGARKRAASTDGSELGIIKKGEAVKSGRRKGRPRKVAASSPMSFLSAKTAAPFHVVPINKKLKPNPSSPVPQRLFANMGSVESEDELTNASFQKKASKKRKGLEQSKKQTVGKAMPTTHSEDMVIEPPLRRKTLLSGSQVPRTSLSPAAEPVAEPVVEPVAEADGDSSEEENDDREAIYLEEIALLKNGMQELQQLYEKLRDTGLKGAEEKHRLYVGAAEDRIKACEEYNNNLQTDVESLREQLQTTTASLSAAQSEVTRLNSLTVDLQAQLDASVTKGQNIIDEEDKNRREQMERERMAIEEEMRREVEKVKAREVDLGAAVDRERQRATSLERDLKMLSETHAILQSKFATQQGKFTRIQGADRYLITVERMVRMYEELTGVTIENVEDVRRQMESGVEEPAVAYKCRQKGRAGVLEYTLMTPPDGSSKSANPTTIPGTPRATGALPGTPGRPATSSPSDPSYYTYEPLVRTVASNDDNAAIQLPNDLPEWLQESIDFEQDMCSMFFWRVCDYLQGSEEAK
ncbi:hypothetical protein DFS34DRAFT_650171 [Phlyctochytrium arcticum]|nr:hypothetical protein DFS34DRAFT_650171 [Phlyctochytrium arcticum]